jgi:hypothetical protein
LLRRNIVALCNTRLLSAVRRMSSGAPALPRGDIDLDALYGTADPHRRYWLRNQASASSRCLSAKNRITACLATSASRASSSANCAPAMTAILQTASPMALLHLVVVGVQVPRGATVRRRLQIVWRRSALRL